MKRALQAAGVGCFVLALLAHWRLEFFYYYYDEVVMLWEMMIQGPRVLFSAQNEHIVPFFKAVLFAYVRVFGNHAQGLHTLTVFTHGLTALVVGVLVLRLSCNRFTAVMASVLFACNPLIWATLFLQSGIATVLSVLTWLAALLCFVQYETQRRHRWLGASATLLVVQSYTFGNNLFYPGLFLLYLAWRRRSIPRWYPVFVVALQLLNLWAFFRFAWGNAQSYQQGITAEALVPRARYFFFSFHANFGRTLLLWDPQEALVLIGWPFAGLALLTLGAFVWSFVVFLRRPQHRPALAFGWAHYGLVVALVAVARGAYPLQQALASRYVYLFSPALLFILVPLWLTLEEQLEPRLTQLRIVAACCAVALIAFRQPVVERERRTAELLHADNWQLVQFGLRHPGYKLDVSQLAGPLGWDGLREVVCWLDRNSVLRLEQSVPASLQRQDKRYLRRNVLP